MNKDQLVAAIANSEAFLAMAIAQGQADSFVESLREELISNQSKLAELEGGEPEGMTADIIQRSISLEKRKLEVATTKLNELLKQKEADEAFKRTVVADYAWDTDPMKEELLKLIQKFDSEAIAARSELIKLQGAETFRVGYEADTDIDKVLSPSMAFVVSPTKTYETLYISDEGADPDVTDPVINDNIDALIWYIKHGSMDRVRSLFKPIFELAQATAERNHARSYKEINSHKATEMERIWSKVNKRLKQTAKRAGMLIENENVPPMSEVQEAISGNMSYNIDIVTWDVEEFKRNAGADWDDSIMEVIQFLVAANSVKLNAPARPELFDIKAMEQKLTKMSAPFAHTLFIDDNDPMIAAAAKAGANVFAAEREKLRVLINAKKNEAVRKSAPRRRN